MPQEFRLRELKGFPVTRASPPYSVTFLGTDLKKDIFSILSSLLKDTYSDFLILQSSQRPDISVDKSAQSRVVARLNVLVLISKRVFQAVCKHPMLRAVLLRAIYHILRLPIWHYNRSLRCAALRCLRYYVHSSFDFQLLLECRLDLLIARCMDLSYHQTNFVASSELTGNYTRRGTDYNPRAKFVAPLNSPISSTSSSRQFTEESSSCLITDGSQHQTSGGNSGVLFRKGPNFTRFSRPPLFDPTHPMKSLLATRSAGSYVSTISERQIVLRLIHHLTRLTPHLIPPSLINAVVAPCLEVHRHSITGLNKTGQRGAIVGPTAGPHRTSIHSRRVGDFPEINVKFADFDEMELDTTIRSCLLILCELGMYQILSLTIVYQNRMYF
ncbi:unnamed protein product [Heterobilharzia americana]|nr:unnamed protein product [Heterobilharzia americana]